MLLGDNSKGIQSLTEINHNDKGDPHPQYDRFLIYTSPNSGSSTSDLYFKVFNINVQQTPNNMSNSWEQYAGGLILSFDYYSAYTSKRPYDTGRVDIIAVFDGSGGFAPFLCAKSSITNGTNIDFYLYYKQNTNNTTTTEYNLKLYAKVSNNYMNLSIIPRILNTCLPNGNYYNKFYLTICTNNKERLDALFSDFVANNAISETELSTDITSYSTVGNCGTNNVPSVAVTYTGEDSTTISVSGAAYLLLGSTSTGQILSTLTGGIVGQTLTLISFNERTTLSSGAFNSGIPTTNTMILKNEASTVIPRGRTLTLKNYNGVWYEIGRNYSCDYTITYTNGTSVDVTNGGILALSATTVATLSTLSGGTIGQEITVVATTANTTLTSGTFSGGSPTANTIILKLETSVALAIGNVIKLKYMLGAWIEISRNF